MSRLVIITEDSQPVLSKCHLFSSEARRVISVETTTGKKKKKKRITWLKCYDILLDNVQTFVSPAENKCIGVCIHSTEDQSDCNFQHYEPWTMIFEAETNFQQIPYRTMSWAHTLTLQEASYKLSKLAMIMSHWWTCNMLLWDMTLKSWWISFRHRWNCFFWS